MTVKPRVQTLIVLLSLAALGLQACMQLTVNGSDAARSTSTGDGIPTWTPRSVEAAALQTATQPVSSPKGASVTKTATTTPASTATPAATRTPKRVIVTAVGGNLSVRRGPGVDYNASYALYEGETAIAIGRDRISRWILIELDSPPGIRGWVTTETQYASIQGDVSNLPFMTAEPASPAYIRNCTKHDMWILPADVQLLDKYSKPYNEERFAPGFYQVYDLEDPKASVIQEIDLAEGRTVDIRYDWAGEKSKCD